MKHPFASFALALTVTSVQLGCAIPVSHGTEVTEAQAASFKPGVTTIDELVGALGKPSLQQTRPNGEHAVGYVHVRSRINPPSIDTLTGVAPKTEVLGTNLTVFIFGTDSRLLRTDRVQSDPHGRPTTELAHPS